MDYEYFTVAQFIITRCEIIRKEYERHSINVDRFIGAYNEMLQLNKWLQSNVISSADRYVAQEAVKKLKEIYKSL